MLKEEKSPKKVKDLKIEIQKIIENHKKAAMHHEAAALRHHEAAKNQLEGNSMMACGCNCKVRDQTKLVINTQNKNSKKQSAMA